MNKNTKIALVVVCVAVIAISLYSLFSTRGSSVIKVGIINPSSGPAEKRGEEISNVIKLASSTSLEMYFADDQCDPAKAEEAYNSLKKNDIHIFYVSCSGTLLKLAPLVKADGNLILTSYAGAIEIGKTGDEVIRFIPDALSLVNTLFDYSNKIAGSSKLGILFEEQDYSGFVAGELIKKLGTSTIISSERYTSKDYSVASYVSNLKKSGVDTALFIPGIDKNCNFPFASKDLRIKSICFDVGFAEKASSGLGYDKFLAKYKEQYGIETMNPYYDAVTYDVFILISKYAQTHSSKSQVKNIKKYFLNGVKGEMSEYTFTPNGEVKPEKFFVQAI